MKTGYQCEICMRWHSTSEEALACEAKGRAKPKFGPAQMALIKKFVTGTGSIEMPVTIIRVDHSDHGDHTRSFARYLVEKEDLTREWICESSLESQ